MVLSALDSSFRWNDEKVLGQRFLGAVARPVLVARWAAFTLIVLGSVLFSPVSAAQITIAAASSTRPALDELVAAFSARHPDEQATVVYAASGKLFAQIRQGAPFDVFVSADTTYPEALFKAAMSDGAVQVYGFGRLVLWRSDCREGLPTMHSLSEASVKRIAIANPDAAPYGQRTQQALQAAGLWKAVKGKLVFAENVGQAAQFALSGNAQVGIIALSLALAPAMRDAGCYAAVPDRLYEPLAQGFVVTRRGADKPLAAAFAAFMTSAEAASILQRHGLEPFVVSPP
ncbi:MAG: molybdate ABC transporter substrate-binding protein [Xanthomonadaceae bacterium]|nr:molybdate ABC transporter substrate-binding protein [Xanthomonadaceae bacterium]MDP2186936.1 molybdate ABC transporter substrate-binding protein [Xanthomonadales bacterium]MDZ4116260.1 molybdate ABC transporter substrate-binding protein [Xanthomonadaceae bacterium]MDZ4377693.1 molybdate ABC transporter substrate-binding protein [Xanthomonadaceae bacterium]